MRNFGILPRINSAKCGRTPITRQKRFGRCAQVIARHQGVSGAAGAAASTLGFASTMARQRHEAKARTMLACWIADTGQGFQEDVESACCRGMSAA